MLSHPGIWKDPKTRFTFSLLPHSLWLRRHENREEAAFMGLSQAAFETIKEIHEFKI
jgi:hypothetical protein